MDRIAGVEQGLGENAPARILARASLLIEGETIPVNAAVNLREGRFLQQLVLENKPADVLEVGLANALSALFIEVALKALGGAWRHTVIDPLQARSWENAGLRLLETAALGAPPEFYPEGSETVLPRLADEGRRFDFIFIDGWHTFDHALVDAFYATRMLRVGGLLVLDDANWPAIARLVRLLRRYPCYRPAGACHAPLLQRLGAGIATFSMARLGPSMVALRKVAEDERSWNWNARF